MPPAPPGRPPPVRIGACPAGARWPAFALAPRCRRSASAGFRDRRVGDGGRCVWIQEVQLGVVGVVGRVRVGNGYRVQHGEVDGRPGTRAVRTALDGEDQKSWEISLQT